MTTKLNLKWIKLTPLPADGLSKIININADEFIATSNNNILYKYNFHDNTLKPFEPFQMRQIRTAGPLAFNESKQELYFHKDSDTICAYNIQTNHICNIRSCTKMPKYFLFIDNKFHFINNYDNYCIASRNCWSLKTLHKSESIFEADDGSVIYIPSKQCLLLIGGCIKSHEKKNVFGLSTVLWLYSLKTQTWKCINNIYFKSYAFGAVLTSNQRYIVLFGGYNNDRYRNYESNNIFVLDMTESNFYNWKLRKSTIMCPIGGYCKAVRIGGIDTKCSVLTVGYIRKCFKRKEFRNLTLPPQSIINMIAELYSTEMIHWFKDSKHYAIRLKDILHSLCD